MTKNPKEAVPDQTVITSVEKIGEESEKHAYVLFLSGPLVGKLHHLDEGTTTLGRAEDVDVFINDNRISRHHISVTVDRKKVTLKDLGSTNGTYVNGQKVQECALKDGDRIQISSATIFKFAYQDKLENVFHKELYKMAVVDVVTNVYNKRFFLERLKDEFSHARRGLIPLALLMIDVDHFKQTNDTHGHLAGDFALAHLAGLIQKMIRDEDVLARYGGEEFAVILRSTDEKGAYPLAERIRKMIEKNPLHFEGKILSMTISIGIASLQKDNFDGPESFIAGADQMLYLSKQNGRNRTTSEHHKP